MDAKIKGESTMINLQWHEIGYDSSTINRIAYLDGELYVEFKKNNSGYKYRNIPFEIYQSIMNKECISKRDGKNSYGATLDQLVKKTGYLYEQYQ